MVMAVTIVVSPFGGDGDEMDSEQCEDCHGEDDINHDGSVDDDMCASHEKSRYDYAAIMMMAMMTMMLLMMVGMMIMMSNVNELDDGGEGGDREHCVGQVGGDRC